MRRRRRIGPRYIGGEAIAIPGYRLDAAAVLSVLIEDVAQLRNLDVKVGFLDYPSRPDRRHDLVFRDQLPLSLDEQAEQIDAREPSTTGVATPP